MTSLRVLIAVIAILPLQGCFTGVESTPKITYSDVKKEKIPVIPEQQFLSDIGPEPPAEWKAGKKFFVADRKISIALSSASDLSSLANQDIVFVAMRPAPSVTGEDVTEIEFKAPDGSPAFYRDNLPYSEIKDRKQMEVPFTIEESLVEAVRGEMAGNTYYIITPLWYSADGEKSVNGLRHVPVKIVGIEPGNAVYPIRAVFEDINGEKFSVYMTVGNQRTSTRNFHTLFAFENPREKYPRITDDNWELITHSKVRDGMTREECKLALGSPSTIGQRPSTAGMVEYWQYSDGIFLLFEDGFLTNYRR